MSTRPATRLAVGYSWRCQIPGKLWVAEHNAGYRFQFRRKSGAFHAGWWLTGKGLDVWMGPPRTLFASMKAAAPLMESADRRTV